MVAFLGTDTTSQAIEMGFPFFFFFPMSETDFGGLWRSVTTGFVRDFSAGVDWFRGRAGTAGVLLAVLGWVSVLVNVNQPKIKIKKKKKSIWP